MVKVKVEIKPRKEVYKELIELAKDIDSGEYVKSAEDIEIVFESFEAFRKMLTPERLKILQTIRERHPGSVNELAKLLKKDRRNLVKDLEALRLMGFIEFEERKRRKKPVVAYDEILVSIPVVI